MTVSLSSWSNVEKALRPSLSKPVTLRLLVLPISHLRTSRYRLRTPWAQREEESSSFSATLTMSDGLFVALLREVSVQLSRNVSSMLSMRPSYIFSHHAHCRWTAQRKAFGKPLNSQAVIRSKLAIMIQMVESVQNWLENITYQMNNMVRFLNNPQILPLTHLPRTQSYQEQATKLAGSIGLLKMYSTKCAQQIATDAVQIFGGRGITRLVTV